ncbi:MAG: PD40 domain-containing protein [Rhizobacter sp.]|nr:PD40 domain-containing protein [Ferruginibacter sp.]
MTKVIYLLTYILISNIAFGQVKLFEPNLISDNQAFGLTISPSGKELFFVKSFGGRDTLQIYHSMKVNGQWQIPTLATFADTRFRQIDPAFSPDGNTILFNSLNTAQNSFDIYVTNKTSTGWTTPERLSDSINTTSGDFYATMTNKKNIYFTRRSTSNDIYVSYFVNNKYQKAVLLDKTINTEGNESNPYISKNEDFIIFFAEYENGFGDSDLYISFKKRNKWSYPINLGNEINSKVGEFCPSIDLKNQLFLFSRTEDINGKRFENMYSYPFKNLKIRKLKKLAKWDN